VPRPVTLGRACDDAGHSAWTGFSAPTGPRVTEFVNDDPATAFDGATQYIEVPDHEALSVPANRHLDHRGLDGS